MKDNYRIPTFFVGDPVSYTGSHFRDRLGGKKGWIYATVEGQPECWIVEFPETRSKDDRNDTDDYVMSAGVLAKWQPSAAELKKQEGPEIQPRRSKKWAEGET